MLNFYLRYWRLLLLIGATVGVSSTTAIGQPFSAEIEQIMTIGRGGSSSGELTLPAHIATDDNDRIYIADRSRLTINVYSQAGDFLRTIGAPGSDTGEFQRITAMTVDRQNHLLVADMFARRITRFSASGKVIRTHAMPLSKMKWPRQLYHLRDGRYVVLFKQSGSDTQHTHLIHLFGETLERREVSLGRMEDLWPVSESWLEEAGRLSPGLRPGQLWPGDNQQIYYVPTVYSGRIYQFEQQNNQWTITRVLQGHSPSQELLKEQRGTNTKLTESRGIYTLSDGRIVHFSARHAGGKKTFGVEFFTPDNSFAGYSPLPAIRIPESESWDRYVHVAWKDDQDRFYIIDSEGSKSFVRVVRLTLK